MSAETIAELSVRVARAEIERDAIQKRYDELSRSFRAWHTKDKDELLDTLHIIGIPARDLVDIYKIEQEWVRNGGNEARLAEWREFWAFREALEFYADSDNWTQPASWGGRIHDDESLAIRDYGSLARAALGGCGGVQDG